MHDSLCSVLQDCTTPPATDELAGKVSQPGFPLLLCFPEVLEAWGDSAEPGYTVKLEEFSSTIFSQPRRAYVVHWRAECMS